MKKLILSIGLLASLNCWSATNIVNIMLPRQNFFAGQATLSQATNTCPITNLDGYIYPSNFTGIVRYQFPSDIITSSNFLISCTILTTNINDVVLECDRVLLFTNDGKFPYFDSGEVTNYGIKPLANTNIQAVISTNIVLPTDIMNVRASNSMYGTVYFRLGPASSNFVSTSAINTQWFLRGYIQFP